MADHNDLVQCYVPNPLSEDDDMHILLNDFNSSLSDTYVFPNDEEMVTLFNNFDPNLSEINEPPIPHTPFEMPQEISHEISDVDVEDLLLPEPIVEAQDVGINDAAITPGGGSFQGGPSQVNVENPPPGDHNSMESTPFEDRHNLHIGLNFPRLPPMAKPFYCTYCEVLRDIIHTNGVEYTTFEIHGRLGFICHGIQRQNIIAGSLLSHKEYRMIDFKKKNADEIKSILMEYCLQRNQAGYHLVADILSSYYEVLCIGLDWADDDHIDPATAEAENQMADWEPEHQKPFLTEQKERVARMKLTDFCDYFHLPLDDAAKLVGLCPTVINKICRKEGLTRWPHRKVKSIVKQISALKKNMESGDDAFRAQTQADIDSLYSEIVRHCGGIAPTSLIIE